METREYNTSKISHFITEVDGHRV